MVAAVTTVTTVAKSLFYFFLIENRLTNIYLLQARKKSQRLSSNPQTNKEKETSAALELLRCHVGPISRYQDAIINRL